MLFWPRTHRERMVGGYRLRGSAGCQLNRPRTQERSVPIEHQSYQPIAYVTAAMYVLRRILVVARLPQAEREAICPDPGL
jgi:hypothetical protein